MGGKKKKSPKKEQEPPPLSLPRRLYDGLLRLAWCTVAIVVILYGSMHAVARTDGFKSVVSGKLSALTGMVMSIETLTADWELDLAATGIQSEGYEKAGHPGFRAERAKIDWAPFKLFSKNGLYLRSLDLVGCTFAVVPSGKGGWLPGPMSEATEWLARYLHITELLPATLKAPSETEVQVVPPFFLWQHKYIDISIAEGVVYWLDRTGRERVTAEGLSLSASPIYVENRNLVHYRLSVDLVKTPDGPTALNVAYEFLKSGGQYIDLEPLPAAAE